MNSISLKIEDLLKDPVTKADLGIICRSKEEWDKVLEIYNPLDLDDHHYEDNAVVYTDGAHSTLRYLKSMKYQSIEARDFILANSKILSYELY